MAKKTTKIQQDISILDRLLTDEDTGETLHIYAKLNNTESNIQAYFIALCKVRQIPTQDEIPAGDAVVTFIYDQLYEQQAKNQTEEDERLIYVVAEAETYYQLHRNVALSEATILALTTEKEFKNPPRPYPEEDHEVLPGFIEIPPPEKNITHSKIEQRLKQLRDFLDDNPNLGMQFLALTKDLNSRITTGLVGQAKSQAGFQSNGND